MQYILLFAIKQKLFLAENSEIPIFTIYFELEVIFFWKKGIHWLGQGFKTGLDEKGGKTKKIKELIFVISTLIL